MTDLCYYPPLVCINMLFGIIDYLAWPKKEERLITACVCRYILIRKLKYYISLIKNICSGDNLKHTYENHAIEKKKKKKSNVVI